MISKKTGCPTYEVTHILNTLGDVIKDTISNGDTEMYLCPGVKLNSQWISPEQSRSNHFFTNDVQDVLHLKFDINSRFRKDISKIHKEKVHIK